MNIVMIYSISTAFIIVAFLAIEDRNFIVSGIAIIGFLVCVKELFERLL